MKKRRTLIIALLLVAAMTLGIGYAEMTKILTINGDGILNQNDSSFVVQFTDGTITEGKGTITNFTSTGPSTSADFNVENICNIGDKAVITLTVTNNSTATDLKANLVSVNPGEYTLTYFNEDGSESPVDESGGKFFGVTYVIKDKTGATVWDTEGKEGEGLTLANGESATMEITVEVLRTIKSKVKLAGADFTLDFKAIS